MKDLCLISPAFAFPVGERDLYYPHGELARALHKRGIKTTIICLGPSISRQEDHVSVHAVPLAPNNAQMLADWMPSNSYYLSAASALWQKYTELAQSQKFDLLDIPDYLPFDVASVAHETALIVRSYHQQVDGLKQHGSAFPVDRLMLESMQALALLEADAVLVDEEADAESNRWSRKLRNAFTARLMSELEAAVFADDKPILPRNDLATIMIGTSATDSQWALTNLRAMAKFLQTDNGVRFIMPIFQRSLTSEENEILQQIKQKLKDTGKLDRLYLIQPLAINKLNGCIRSVDAVVAPVRDSGLPCIGMEALSAGKPIIAQRANPLSTFIEMHDCGSVIENDSPENEETQLLNSFTQVLKTTDAGARGKEASAKLFEDYINVTLKCYASGLEAHSEAEKEQNKALTASATATPNTHQQFLAACDRLLYDIHYKTSLRFRVKHWINRLSQTKRHLHKS